MQVRVTIPSKGSTGAATDSNYIDGQAGIDWVNYSPASSGLDITMGTAVPTTVVVGSAVDTLVMLRTSPPPTSMTRLLPQLRAV